MRGYLGDWERGEMQKEAHRGQVIVIIPVAATPLRNIVGPV